MLLHVFWDINHFGPLSFLGTSSRFKVGFKCLYVRFSGLKKKKEKKTNKNSSFAFHSVHFNYCKFNVMFSFVFVISCVKILPQLCLFLVLHALGCTRMLKIFVYNIIWFVTYHKVYDWLVLFDQTRFYCVTWLATVTSSKSISPHNTKKN